MKVTSHSLHPPKLQEIARIIEKALQQNFETASVTVVDCPDLRHEPFNLAARGLTGTECIADIGGQPNLFPSPKLSARYSLISIAEQMKINSKHGMLIGAGAGPFFEVGVNNELAPNIGWHTDEGKQDRTINNLTRYTRVNHDGSVSCLKSPSTNCALMMNLFGSEGLGGPVLKITARKNTGGRSLTDYMRFGLRDHYNSQNPVSIGGVFVMKKGTAQFHVMPDFPPADEMPFKNPKQLNDWLTWHKFAAPMVCLSVMHTVDPEDESGNRLGLRMEHTHCFATHRDDQGGHYHHDISGDAFEDVEYEGYFNTAKMLFRIDRPDIVLEKDLHD